MRLVFARLCDVDPRRRSWNVCDGLVRIRDGDAWTQITVPMSLSNAYAKTGTTSRHELVQLMRAA